MKHCLPVPSKSSADVVAQFRHATVFVFYCVCLLLEEKTIRSRRRELILKGMLRSNHRSSERREVVLRWNRVARLPDYDNVVGTGSSVTLIGNALYVARAGGQMTVLSCKTWRWKPLGDCLFGLGEGHIAQLAEDKIYYCGGGGADVLVQFDPVLQEATEVARIGERPFQRQYMTSVFAAWRGEVITFGGFFFDYTSRSNETHAFNVISKSWKKLVLQGKPPEPRTVHSATLYGTKMYIYGGYTQGAVSRGDLWIAELGRFKTPSWTQALVHGTIPHARTVAALNAVNGMLILFGGYCEREHVRDTHVYLPETSNWCGQNSLETLVQGNSPKLTEDHHGITVYAGVLYLTRSGVFRLSHD